MLVTQIINESGVKFLVKPKTKAIPQMLFDRNCNNFPFYLGHSVEAIFESKSNKECVLLCPGHTYIVWRIDKSECIIVVDISAIPLIRL